MDNDITKRKRKLSKRRKVLPKKLDATGKA